MEPFLMDEETSKKYAFFFAVDQGRVDIINFLLKKGVDIDAQDEDGNTALHYAVVRGNNFLINYLLERNAKIILNKKSRTPLLDAYSNNQSYAVSIITKFSLERNSWVNFENDKFKKLKIDETTSHFINDCKNHVRKNYLDRNLLNRIFAKHNKRGLALINALNRCKSVSEVYELTNNQTNLLKGILTRSISKYLLPKRWSKEIKNRPKDIENSSFYKMLKTFPKAPEAPKMNIGQQTKKTSHL